MACGVGQELYVFGGVRSQENDNPEQRQMTTCKSEFYHDEIRRYVWKQVLVFFVCFFVFLLLCVMHPHFAIFSLFAATAHIWSIVVHQKLFGFADFELQIVIAPCNEALCIPLWKFSLKPLFHCSKNLLTHFSITEVNTKGHRAKTESCLTFASTSTERFCWDKLKLTATCAALSPVKSQPSSPSTPRSLSLRSI